MGFEPTYDGFANRCLTTWLPRRQPEEPRFLPGALGRVKRARSGAGLMTAARRQGGVDFDVEVDVEVEVGVEVEVEVDVEVDVEVGVDVGVDVGVEVGVDVGVDVGVRVEAEADIEVDDRPRSTSPDGAPPPPAGPGRRVGRASRAPRPTWPRCWQCRASTSADLARVLAVPLEHLGRPGQDVGSAGRAPRPTWPRCWRCRSSASGDTAKGSARLPEHRGRPSRPGPDPDPTLDLALALDYAVTVRRRKSSCRMSARSALVRRVIRTPEEEP